MREIHEPEGRGPAVLNVARHRRVTRLPTGRGLAHQRGGLAAELDARRRRYDRGLRLRGIKIRRLARAPAALARFLRDHERGGNALGELAVALQEHATGLEETRRRHAARLVERERVEQSADERRTQVRLVLDKGIRQRERADLRGRGPGREFPGRAQGVVHALVEPLPHQRGGDVAVEQYDRVVVAHQAGRLDDGGRNLLGAVETHDLLDEVDGALQVVAPTRDGEGPGRSARLGGNLLGDDEFEALQRGAHLVGGDFETELLVDVDGCDRDLAFPRDVRADHVYRPRHYAAGVGEDEIDEAMRGLLQGVRIHAALVAIRGV